MSKKILKIVIIVNKLSGGGAERVAALWATGFVEKGYNVTVLISETINNFGYNISKKVCVKYIGLILRNSTLSALSKKIGISRWYYKRRLYKELQKIKPDICIGVLGNNALDAYKATRNLNTIVIQTEHNAYDRPDFLKSRSEIIKRKFKTNRIFDCVTVLSKADTLVKDVPTENMVVLPNPLTFNPIQEIGTRDNTILAVGRLDSWYIKGFDNLINAWGKIAKKYPNWKLQIAGTGSLKSQLYLQNLVKINNINSQIEFLGYCKDVCSLYRKTSVFVLSSRYEGFGMVLTEAMSQGCACIACDFGGRQKEIITTEKQGIICTNDNINELVKAIEKMIVDSDYRESCREPAIERSGYYSLENTILRWEQLFNKLIN